MTVEVKQFRFGSKAKQQTCLSCQHFEKFAENIGLCRRFNFEVWISLAKKTRACVGMEG